MHPNYWSPLWPKPLPRSRRHFRLHQSLWIYDVFRQFIQKLVCLGFLIQSLLQKFRGLILTQQLRKGAHTAVTGDLVMLDFLRSHDDGCIDNGIFAICFKDLRSLVDQAFHGLAGFALCLLTEFFEDFLKPLHMTLGLFEMLFESF